MEPAPATYQLLAVGDYPTQLTRLFGHCDHARYRWSCAANPDPEQPGDWVTGAEFVELNARDPRHNHKRIFCRWMQVSFTCDCAAHPKIQPQW